MADARTYIKVHDGMPRHPKIVGLSDRAFRTIVTAWCYSSEYLTDGLVSVTSWTNLVPGRGRKVVDAVTSELTEAGLIEVRDGSVYLHDYLEHQRSKAQVEHVQRVRSESGKLGGRPPKAKQNASGLVPQPESKPVSKKNPETEEEVLRTSSQTETDDDARVAQQPPAPQPRSSAPARPSQDSLDLAAKAVAATIGTDRPPAIRKGLVQRAAWLLDDGAVPADLPLALTEWRNTPDARISWLDYKVADVASRREAVSRPKPTPKQSTRGDRAQDCLDRKALYEEAEAQGYTTPVEQFAYIAAVQAGRPIPDRSVLADVIELPAGRSA